MLHNEARNLLVEAYEKTHDAKGIASVYGVSVPTVYRLAEQKAKTGSVNLRVSKRGRKRVLEQDASEQERPRCAGQERTTEWVCEDNTGFPSGFPG